MVSMASGITGGCAQRRRTTTLHNMAAIQLTLSYVVFDYSIYLWYQTSILTTDSGGWSNVFNMGLHWSKNKLNRKQELTSRKRRSEREWTSAGEGGETVLDNAVNYNESGARERRWNNTLPWRKVNESYRKVKGGEIPDNSEDTNFPKFKN